MWQAGDTAKNTMSREDGDRSLPSKMQVDVRGMQGLDERLESISFPDTKQP